MFTSEVVKFSSSYLYKTLDSEVSWKELMLIFENSFPFAMQVLYRKVDEMFVMDQL